MVDIQRPFSAFTSRNDSIPRRVGSATTFGSLFKSDTILVAPKPIKAATPGPLSSLSSSSLSLPRNFANEVLSTKKCIPMEVESELQRELSQFISLFSETEELDLMSSTSSYNSTDSSEGISIEERPSLDTSPVSSSDDTDSITSSKSLVFGTPPSRSLNPLARYCEHKFYDGDSELDIFSPSPVLGPSQEHLPFEIEDIRI